jgi:chromosome partitioning protein
VITYDPLSSGALSYLEAATELAERGAADPAEPADQSDQSDRSDQSQPEGAQ